MKNTVVNTRLIALITLTSYRDAAYTSTSTKKWTFLQTIINITQDMTSQHNKKGKQDT